MPSSASEHHLGPLKIVKVPELELNDLPATQLLPGLEPDFAVRHPAWLDPRTYDVVTGKARMSVHTWVVRHGDQTLLIDTGGGNNKDRPTMQVLDHLREPYLERLAAVGVQPEQVDHVLLTHVHADHVGWNTRLEAGRWVPTFPNATVLCSAREWRYGAALAAGDEAGAAAVRAETSFAEPTRTPVAGVFEDSMAPLAAAGRLRLVEVDGREVLPGVRFLPTPGHSVDHAAISIAAGETLALFGGDVLHHPFEIFDPTLVSMFCEFPAAARQSRRWLLEHAVNTGARYFSSHFPASSAGRITRQGDTYGWEFLDGEDRSSATPAAFV